MFTMMTIEHFEELHANQIKDLRELKIEKMEVQLVKHHARDQLNIVQNNKDFTCSIGLTLSSKIRLPHSFNTNHIIYAANKFQR